MMIHDIDLACVLNKTGVATIKCSGKKVQSDKLDEASATLYFKDGMVAKIYGSRAKNDKYRFMQITTDHAIYDVDLLTKTLYKREFETLVNKTEIETHPADQITLEQKDFYSSIANNRKPKCPATQAVPVMKVAEEVEAKCLSQ